MAFEEGEPPVFFVQVSQYVVTNLPRREPHEEPVGDGWWLGGRRVHFAHKASEWEIQGIKARTVLISTYPNISIREKLPSSFVPCGHRSLRNASTGEILVALAAGR